ncbi:uncharacterized protein B0I36DRAFT_364851 [Microdochium trichocladiopsis]|uniref:Spc7 kinetochore protein domain-containing protein n=1 Tax=Microdochium trichocladiopsis TaxID=1682393 RepID=A0A9P8Y2I6_9PEZI|nr:uncharacterized protein B0I36DRAFT_364851 [Microdochium trichocladiopsis]KAH7027679.1 hypothetical protein B0I36DRAFT_364851 [Microdochium trichocladiopsis]
MAGRAETTLPATRRPRKSTGHSPVRKRIEKENITVDMASSLAANAGRKKLRSKSIGPGGLDGLKSAAGNRRVSLAAPSKPPPRSILKPTIPVLPEIPPHKPRGKGADKNHNDAASTSGTKVALRTEEEQQAAAREREEREKALEKEKEIKDRREARRKSLANRRVSFAAEATLHTFHEIEYMQDTTASSNSNRRASSSGQRSQGQNEDEELPSTPPDQTEDVVPGSPDDQRDMHKKSRRSSGAGPLTYTHNDEDTMASTVYSSDSEATEGVIEADDVDSDSGSDSDADGVSVDLDVDEVTGTTVASLASAMSRHSDLTTGSTDTLEGALRLATNRAVTQTLDEDEEIIPSFGWVKKPQPKPSTSAANPAANGALRNNEDTLGNVDATMDLGSEMELTRPIGGIIDKDDDAADESYLDEEMSMDVTRALGGIVSGAGSLRSHGQAPEPGSPMSEENDDATMELTMAVGGIKHQPRLSEGDLLEFDDNEEMSMELTTVLGKVLPGKRKSLPGRRRISTANQEDATMDMTMDMTTDLGRILPNDNDEDELLDEATADMDMTMAVGGIISEPSPARSRSQAKHIMEQEVNEADVATPDISSSAKRRLSEAVNPPNATTTKSPGRTALNSRAFGQSLRAPPSSSPFKSSPFRDHPTSPIKRSPQKPAQANTPSKTASPRKTPSQPLNTSRFMSGSPRRTPTSITKPGRPLSAQKPTSASRIMSPLIVLTPQQRRLSGLGADRAGLGSPKVVAMFERRESLGQAAETFVPRESIGAQRGVSFADPQLMAEEFDRELQETGPTDEDNNTATLRDMIASMTPKKNPLNGRKSLAVGSAAGLLGKRPLELDDDEDDDEDFEPMDGVKRLKNHQGSPVKNIRLNAPPTKAETWSNSVNSTMTFSPKKKVPITTSPKSRKYLNFVESDLPTGTLSFEHTIRMEDEEDQDNDDGSRIHLQDFLNMTSIRFIELTTTKSRPTQGPRTTRDSFVPNKDDVSLERRVVAGACTVPMLELYQHSCRELKKYISEGRRIIREIETETLEENPPLFQEYMNATPDFKIIMDNQFKNVKTHARLLSKAMWYEWRSQLQEGLKEGLIRIGEGMDNDEKLLNKEQKLLDSVLPGLQKQLETLESEHRNLRVAADELADGDPEDLQAARDELEGLDEDVAAKTAKIETLRLQLAETEASISDCTQQRTQCIADIEQSEKIREECRGWTSSEVSVLKAEVDNLERAYGWTITGIAGSTVSMTYLKEVELVFDMSALEGRQPAAQVDLWYIAANRELCPIPSTPDREFFLQCIRDYVRSAVQGRTRMSELLPIISRSWDKAIEVSHNLRILNSTFPTTISRTSDSSVLVRTVLLIAPLQTKVEISLDLRGRGTADGLDVTITPTARVVYGEHFKVDKVSDYLSTNLGTNLLSQKTADQVGSWSNVVVDLHQRLLARGRK